MILGEHYRLIQELGQGGFGRTYLAEDLNRYNERCVLKEFVPQVQGDYALQKAAELFQREAGVLYQLSHPQIPQFRELLRVQTPEKEQLFLVQDYVEGQTYRALLDARRPQGLCFSELEVTQLLRQILPVLSYIHGLGVIHRDIAPDNLILRYQDGLPVLIDFGGVKQVAATVVQQLALSDAVEPMDAPITQQNTQGERLLTRLGKVGYAPPEQMQSGIVSPASDLYALGTTILTLLTDKEPPDLMDQQTLTWTWPQQVTLSPGLTAVLRRLVAHQPSDRYQSADQVLAALDGRDPGVSNPEPALIPLIPLSQEPDPHELPATGPAPTGPASTQARSIPVAGEEQNNVIWQALLVLALLMGGVGLLFALFRPATFERVATEEGPETSQTDVPFSPEELRRKEDIRDRRQALGVSDQFLEDVTNAEFYAQYPNREGTVLTDRRRDTVWRERWDAIADQYLDFVETLLSPAARANLGNYTPSDFDQWGQAVNRLNLSSQALTDLADAKFFQTMPPQNNPDWLSLPVGQLWYGVAFDQFRTLQNGDRRQEITFPPNSFSQQVEGELGPGEGIAYILNLSENQLMRLNLQAPSQTTGLSIYLPQPTAELPSLLANSAETTWSGRLPQSGYYEIVVVSKADGAIRYQLNVAVDNVTSTPVEPPETDDPDDDSGSDSDSGAGSDNSGADGDGDSGDAGANDGNQSGGSSGSNQSGIAGNATQQ